MMWITSAIIASRTHEARPASQRSRAYPAVAARDTRESNPVEHEMKPSLTSRLGLLPILAFLLAGLVPVLPASAQDCAPVVTIDAPLSNSNVSGQFTFAGWSVDQN